MIGLNTTLYKSVAFGPSACFVGAQARVCGVVHYINRPMLTSSFGSSIVMRDCGLGSLLAS